MNDGGDDLEIIDPEPDPDWDPPSPGPSATRRPRGRRGLAAAAVVVLAGGSLAGIALGHGRSRRAADKSQAIVLPPATVAPSLTPAFTMPIAVDPDAEFIDQMAMVAPGVGWAMNGSALYRTVDDTAHWTNITPPGVTNPSAHAYAVDFLDADHAWIATALDNHPLTIHHTADGGRSWQSVRPNVCGSASTIDELTCGFPVSIDFVDPADGWVLFSPEHVRGTLVATHDGGATWSVVGTTPFVGAVHFTDAHAGWGVAQYPDDALFRTTDGGETWRAVRVPTSATGAAVTSPIDAPQFFGRNDVIASRLATSGTAPPEVIVSASHDGGATWSAHAVPAENLADGTDNSARYEFSASSPSDWAVLLGSQVTVTHDAGRHWSILTPTGGPVTNIDFASASSAWLLAQTQACPSPPVDGCTDAVLLRTTDGGSSWHSASPVLAVTAGRSP